MVRQSDSGLVFILWALMLLVLPLNWLLAAAGAAVFHELCHACAVILSGGSILDIHVHGSGISMEVSPMTDGRELLCALAGPAGSLCLLLFIHEFPRLAVCAGVQGCFNLLPVWPLDGGRALKSGLKLFCSEALAEKICGILGHGVFILILCLGLWFFFGRKLGSAPLVITSILLFRLSAEKNLQKCVSQGTIEPPKRMR